VKSLLDEQRSRVKVHLQAEQASYNIFNRNTLVKVDLQQHTSKKLRKHSNMEANFLNHSIGQQVNSKGGPTMPQITYNDFRNTTVKVHLQ